MRRLGLVLALTWPLAARPALAQMPDARAMSGRPLAVADLPTGTVVLRVVRQSPTNPVAGVDVTSTTRTLSGEARSGTAKTGADGRATFEGLPAGAEFQANVTVDGERLETVRFALPPTGGTRIMLIAGLGAAGAPADPHAGAQPQQNAFRMGAQTGTVAPVPELPAGTLELDLRDGAGRPIVGRKVQLAQVRLKAGPAGEQADREVGLHEAISDQAGRARFKELITGESAGYAAVAEHEGLRVGTQPFRMPTESGMRGQILALRRGADPSVLQLDPRSKIILDLREEAVAVMMALVLRNTSQELFVPGEQGLVIPLPPGAVGAQELEGGEPLEITPGVGIRLKSPIPPDSAASFVTQIRFGYVLPADGASAVELKQVFPMSMADPFILAPAKSGLQVEGPGIRKLKDETDSQGERVFAYTAPPVSPSGTLSLTVVGIPARSRTGRSVAATLCVLLVLAAVVLAGPGRGGRRDQVRAERDLLAQRREKLFAELVAIEEQRRAEGQAGAPGGSNGKLADRRREVVTKLESIYRDLAKLEETASL